MYVYDLFLSMVLYIIGLKMFILENYINVDIFKFVGLKKISFMCKIDS